MNVLDLFSGIGGFSLGLERAGMRTVGFCEINEFCREWLAQQWPRVPIHEDIRALDGAQYAGADLVCGGFPCQDISSAGNGAGLAGGRSGLWFQMLRVIRECRPTWAVIENVTALRTRGADRVLGDLEESGYTCWPVVVGADDIGASHRRKRVWIIARRVADADCFVLRQFEQRMPGGRETGVRDEGQAVITEDGDAAHRDGRGCEGERLSNDSGLEGSRADLTDGRSGAWPADRFDRWPAGPGRPQHDWESPRAITRSQCGLGVSADGLPRNMGETLNKERLKAAGNSIVPQVAEAIGRGILRLHIPACAGILPAQ